MRVEGKQVNIVNKLCGMSVRHTCLGGVRNAEDPLGDMSPWDTDEAAGGSEFMKLRLCLGPTMRAQ